MTRDEKYGVVGTVLLVCGLALAALQVGCGPSARSSALKGAYATVNAASAGFTAWDRAHQKELVETATSLDEAKRRLHEYRDKRRAVDESIIAAYALIGAAALDKGVGMAAVVAAVTAVQRAIDAIRGGP